MFKKHPILTILIAIAALAANGIFVHKSEVGPMITGFYRCLFAIPLLYLIQHLTSTSNNPISCKISTNKQNILTLIAGIALGLDISLYNLSFMYTSMAETNLIVNLTPLIIFPLSIFYFKEKTTPKVLIPFALAISGLYCLVLAKHDGNLATHHGFGNILAFIAALFYAIFIVTTKISADNGVAMNKYMIKVSLYCAIVNLICGYWHQEQLLPSTWWGWADVIIIAICGQIFGQFMLAQGLKRVSLQLSSCLLLLQPVLAAIYGLILFKEYLHFQQIIGGILVLCAVFVFRRIECQTKIN
ncbi:MAG: hypothetical protein RLZZ293_1021 [Pseudomonadota bacterium]|jgi:drug/metabolite transporter (DMT)-like permease